MTANAPKPPGRLTRWRLAEPVRFYLWPAAFIVLLPMLVGTVAPAEGVDRWLLLGWAVTTALILVGSGESIRASVFCEPAHVTECRNTALRVARGELIP